MPYELTNRRGNVVWSEEVIATLAGAAASECPGVVGMAARGVGALAELLGRDSLARGVEVSVREGKVHLTLNIMVGYGNRIPAVGRDVAERVRGAVEEAGIPVGRITVQVQGVRV
ncbi:MAG: Asp23/Gls24 family envelope stress response protein [Bacillota bacterium]|nr:Asp23/Gls24 family envelope stress response protein [Bacillota bacterium]